MTIEQTIIQITSKMLDHKESVINSQSAFVNDLNADSMDCIEILMSIENEFDIEIDDSEFEVFALEAFTVSDIADMVKGRIACG